MGLYPACKTQDLKPFVVGKNAGAISLSRYTIRQKLFFSGKDFRMEVRAS